MANIANHTMPWEERIRCMNKAEDKFQMDYNYRNRDNGSWCYKYGIDNEKAEDKNLRNVDSLILQTPDFLCWDNTEKHFYFVEVKHCGYNYRLKKKHLDNYKRWNSVHPVNFWVKHLDFIAYFPLKRFDELIVKNNYEMTTYAKINDDPTDSHKEMWVIPFKDLLA